jgi:hypothetical protein
MGDMDIKDPAGMNQYTDLANQAQQEYGNQRAFMGANVDPKRKQLLDQLGAQAAGTAPSIAEAQLKSAFDKSLQQQLSLARSGRGNAGLASRNAAGQIAQTQQNIAGQAAVARLQEQNQAQNNLQQAIQNEQQYATGTLGSALGSQANVAAMQNAQRDRNDARTGQLLGGVGQIAGMFLGLAEGGQVPSLESVLKSKYGKSPQKLAYGGQYRADVGSVDQLVSDSQKIAEKGKKGAEQATSFLSGGIKKLNNKHLEEQDDLALDEMTAEFEAEEALKQQPALSSFVPRMPGPGVPVLSPTMLPISRSMPMSKGGNVPGKEEVKGDSFKNDKVPALLSAGEIVIPKSVIDAGPVAAGFFAKRASEDASYNAKTFKAEKLSLPQMLKKIQESEETFNKVSQMLSSKKKKVV